MGRVDRQERVRRRKRAHRQLAYDGCMFPEVAGEVAAPGIQRTDRKRAQRDDPQAGPVACRSGRGCRRSRLVCQADTLVPLGTAAAVRLATGIMINCQARPPQASESGTSSIRTIQNLWMVVCV